MGVNKNCDLVVIELKSDRLIKELLGQLNNFSEIIKEKKVFFKELVKLILKVEWSGKIEKIIVWPHCDNPRPLVLGRMQVKEVCYLATNKGIKFEECKP